MKKLILSVVLLCVITGSAQSAIPKVLQWFGSATNGSPATTDWMDGMAWGQEFTGPPLVHGIVPTAWDSVKINLEWGNPGPIVDEAVEAGEIKISEIVGNPLLQSLTVAAGGSVVTGTPGYGGTPATGWAGQVILGYYIGNVGALIIDGGAMTVAGPLHVGYGGTGILTINSGVLTVNGIGSATGVPIDLTGGSSIAVNGGELRIAGYRVDDMQGYVDDGRLTSGGSGDNVVINYDEATDYTIVTPEPISIALLGLGALLIRKRS